MNKTTSEKKALANQPIASAILAFSLLTSCAPGIPQDLQPASFRLMTDSDFNTSHPANRTSFVEGEGIVLRADVTWPEPVEYGGRHEAKWQLFQDGQLLRESRSDERLVQKPSRILSHISGGSFPPGDYRVALQIDDKPFSTLPFKIVAAKEPALPLTRMTDPDCRDAPRGKIVSLYPLRPNFPQRPVDRQEHGCAAVAVIIGADNRPAGVRVLAENPKGVGFGEAVAQAAWAAIYPPGHFGETTYMVVHFDAVH